MCLFKGRAKITKLEWDTYQNYIIVTVYYVVVGIFRSLEIFKLLAENVYLSIYSY